jgi:hypothetical protein
MGGLILPGGCDDSLEMFGPFVQVNGVGFSLYFLRYRIKNSFSSFLERCTLCFSACRVRMLKKHSTIFIQEACVGV